MRGGKSFTSVRGAIILFSPHSFPRRGKGEDCRWRRVRCDSGREQELTDRLGKADTRLERRDGGSYRGRMWL